MTAVAADICLTLTQMKKSEFFYISHKICRKKNLLEHKPNRYIAPFVLSFT